MFNFDKEKPSKFVATSLISIDSDKYCSPMVWTPGFQQVVSRRVYVVCSVNRNGYNSFRVYPLNRKKDKAPPAFVIVSRESKYAKDPYTHIVFEHKNFVVTRPLIAVYYKAKWALDKKILDILPGNLLTLVKHCYFKDLISDDFIEEAEKEFERLEKVLARANSPYYGEVQASIDRSYKICQKIFSKVKEVLPYS